MELFMLTEEWMLSNAFSPTDLYPDELQGYNIRDGDDEFLKNSLTLNDQLNSLTEDGGISNDFDSWLDEATSISNLDANLVTSSLRQPEPDDAVAEMLAELEASMETMVSLEGLDSSSDLLQPSKLNLNLPSGLPSPVQAPCSPVEMCSLKAQFPTSKKPVVKYVQPSTIDTSTLCSQAQIVMDDLNVLHLPEPDTEEAEMMLLEALADSSLAEQLSAPEVESLLSSPPTSPPSSPDAEVPGLSGAESDDEYVPKRKRKATTPAANPRSLKSLKPNEKKQRKKEQNKNAATKYRLKKRAEDEVAKSELDQLETINSTLRRKVLDLTSEIKYMKGLLNEVLKDKGLRIK